MPEEPGLRTSDGNAAAVRGVGSIIDRGGTRRFLMQLYCERSGSGEEVLLLLHGMAGNGGVWKPLLEVMGGRWPGRILVPDLRGHGRSPQGGHYGYGQHAADIAELLDPGERVTVVAHSMGAVVALAAASGWFGIQIETVLGFGVKLHFSDADIEKLPSARGRLGGPFATHCGSGVSRRRQ